MFFNEIIRLTEKDKGTTAIHGDSNNLEFSVFKLSFMANSIHSIVSINIHIENIKLIVYAIIVNQVLYFFLRKFVIKVIFTCLSVLVMYGIDKKSIDDNKRPTSSSEKDRGDLRIYL